MSVSAQELLKIAASLEKQSEHPFAKAIIRKAGDIALYAVTEFQTLPGQGVSGIIEKNRFRIQDRIRFSFNYAGTEN